MVALAAHFPRTKPALADEHGHRRTSHRDCRVGCAGVLVCARANATSGYETTTRAEESPASREAVLQVVFAKNVTTQQITTTLDNIGGRIVSGPSKAGLYEVELNASSTVNLSVTGAMEHLTASPTVAFVTEKTAVGPLN